MKSDAWYDAFLEILHEKYPKNAQLINKVMDLLCIERETTYRRFRKDVLFTANEIAKIAAAWNISLDEIIDINSGHVSFQMHAIDYLNPSCRDFWNIEKNVEILEHIQTNTYSEYMEVINIFPRPLEVRFPSLLRFKLFNWIYYYTNNESQSAFSQIIIPDNICMEFERYKNNMLHVKNSNFILDEMIFEDFVQSINYFHSILLITEEEMQIIKEELYALLDYMIKIANKGYYPETQNKVNIYISQLAINTNYSYFYTDKLKTCRIHALGKFDISSCDSNMVANFRDWMNAKKRSSILISEANEKKRIEFFGRQREVVEGL